MKNLFKMFSRGRLHLPHNVDYELRDKDGNLKPIFQPNGLYLWLLKLGLVSPDRKIPFLFGYWSTKMTLSNLVVSAGVAGVASRINGAGGEAAFTYIGIGIGVVAANPADTALGAERDETGATNTNHKSATASRVTTDVANDTAQLVVTFNFTATLAITESGAFNATPSGTMLARQVFAAVNVISGDALQVTWKFDVD